MLKMQPATVYLIPCFLDEDGLNALPAYILTVIKSCSVFFVENERTTRRYFKKLDRQIVIDDYSWVNMADDNAAAAFKQHIREGKNIGIVSEAGCPGIADPGQEMVLIAQQMNAIVKPLTGPSSLLMALMASGLNGQQFKFNGYLPVDAQLRNKAIKLLETESLQNNCTQLCIETPYRNQQLLEAFLKVCAPDTLLCLASGITGVSEFVKTLTITQWKKNPVQLGKVPTVFLILGR